MLLPDDAEVGSSPSRVVVVSVVVVVVVVGAFDVSSGQQLPNTLACQLVIVFLSCFPPLSFDVT